MSEFQNGYMTKSFYFNTLFSGWIAPGATFWCFTRAEQHHCRVLRPESE